MSEQCVGPRPYLRRTVPYSISGPLKDWWIAMSTFPSNPCACGASLASESRFCSNCGRPAARQGVVDQRNNHGGVNNTGSVSGDIVVNPWPGWDQRVRIPHERARQHRLVMPPDLLSIVAGLITVGGLFLTPRLPLPLMVATLLLSAAFLFAAVKLLHASQELSRSGFALLPLGLGALEREGTGPVWHTIPASVCPFCPEDRPGSMHLVGTADGARWQCDRLPNHAIGFDFTQMPPLHTGD